MVLTKKQQTVLEFIKRFLKEQGYSPSYREIMAGLEIKSVSTVSEHVENLVAKGYLVKKDGSARSLEPVELATSVAGPATGSYLVNMEDVFRQKLAELESRLPESIDDVAALKKAAELLSINLS